MKKLFISFVITIASLMACTSLGQVCEAEKGSQNVSQGNYDEAFDQLRFCEDKAEVSGLVLGQLATLYGYFGYGDFSTPRQRMQKVYDLNERAALLGDEDSISTMAAIYESGEPAIGLSADAKKAECLNELVDRSDTFTTSMVMNCLKNEPID